MLCELCLAKYAQDLDVDIEVSTWEDVNVHNMLSAPLMNLILMGWLTILKERAFE